MIAPRKTTLALGLAAASAAAKGIPRRARLRRPLALGLAAALAAATAAAGCDTVDLGAPPADINACRPNQQFFAEHVWPEFLDKPYAGGKRCGDGNCHGNGATNALQLPHPTSAAATPLPPDWALLYKSTTEQLTCTNVRSSALLARPSGLQTHGGGKLIDPDGPEAALVASWVLMP